MHLFFPFSAAPANMALKSSLFDSFNASNMFMLKWLRLGLCTVLSLGLIMSDLRPYNFHTEPQDDVEMGTVGV